MFVFDAGAVLKAVTTIRHIESVIRTFQDNEKFKKKDVITRKYAQEMRGMVDEFEDAINGLNVRTTAMAVSELRALLIARKLTITYTLFMSLIEHVAVTLRRELSLSKTFCVESTKEVFFEINFSSFGTAFEARFHEVDEAGKCLALSRPTAAVFHLMRAMEVSLHAIRACLGIPVPVKDWERNWGKILENIEKEISARNSSSPRRWKPGDKEFFESAYASLDAVRVAWRNTTMHVENKYIDDEAEHIFSAVRGFIKKIASRMDEQGQPLA